MKVAYNACFGGFGLSNLATTEFAKKKGVALTWYKQTGYKHNNDELYVKFVGIPEGDVFSMKPLTEDLGDEISEIPQDLYYYPELGGEARCDKDLISVIESLGDLASGNCANLRIKEIPDGVDFEIDEYDGNESVVPPRRSW